MSPSHGATLVLLWAGVAVLWLCSLGVLFIRDAFNRLHFSGPATVLGVPLITAAVLVQKGFKQDGIKAILICAILLATSPILTHAIGRAERMRRYFHLNADPADEVVHQ